MAIIPGIVISYKAEAMQGIHSSADTYKIALYTSAAVLSTATTAYVPTGEVVGTGYTAGGKTLTGFNVSTSSGKAILDFDDPSWSNATITARGALVYNSSKSNKAVCVIDFGQDYTCTNGTFNAPMPTADATNGFLRWN